MAVEPMKDIERKIRLGDSLTDDELNRAYEFFQVLREMLDRVGPYWHFAGNEAWRIERLLSGYRNARKEAR